MQARSDNLLIVAVLLPLTLAGLFAGYRLLSRPTPQPPAAFDAVETMKQAAIVYAQSRIGRPLTEQEIDLIEVRTLPDGAVEAFFNEPLGSMLLDPSPETTHPSTRPLTPDAPSR